jgi:predicted DCC family thiol-disulfide oxidoreductase YuxK
MPELQKIIVFDGVCVLCSRWVDFVLAHDHDRQFQLAAMQTASGRVLLQQHGLDPDSPASFLLLDDAVAYTDSTAILRVLNHFSQPWRIVAALASWIPRSWRDAGYRVIARNRYRWFGRHPVCAVPDPQQADRFLN